MDNQSDRPLAWLRAELGYEPRDPALFRAALTHRSAPGPNNERLEFLGDAVLNLVVAHHLYAAFPHATEGDLSRLRARVVSGEPLAEVAASLGLGEALQLGSGELKTGGFRRQSILADALEAVFGALYLDGGLAAAEAAIERLFGPRIAVLPAPHELKDAKTRLQEYLQSRGLTLPAYKVERVEGEPHAQTFHVACEVPVLRLSAEGCGSSRRRAEQEAAERILSALEPGAGPRSD
ncbi:MAG: ribonuclease III [Gammaproteobacteria bacterium]|nr:ribonuclease III [Gammaproteobacteria bacterium]MDE2262810.1 ribonuclease III [Gammaproteobacteria bacterium]